MSQNFAALAGVAKGQEYSENIVVNRHYLDELPRIVLLILLYILAIYVSIKVPVTVQYIPLGSLFGKQFSIGLPLAGIVPLMLMANIAHSLMNYRYVLTPDYVMEIEGLLDFREKSQRLHYIHIRGMEIEKSVFQKMFNLGDLKLGSPVAQADAEIVLRGIRDPRRFKDIINQRIIEQSGTHESHDNNSIFVPGDEQ